MKKHEIPQTVINDNRILKINKIVEEHTNKLNIMIYNRSIWSKHWEDSEIQECDRLITSLASILSDLNNVLK